jgi:hypothetical protein
LYNYLDNSVKYKDIVHQWDVWHGGKNLGKKVIAVSTVATKILDLFELDKWF